MPILQVASSRGVAGKTAVAVGLARGLVAAGFPVQLLRAGAGPSAEADAVTFASYSFVTSPGMAIGSAVLTPAEGSVTVVELDANQGPLTGQVLLVVREAQSDADVALGSSLGDRLVGTIATLVPAGRIETVARDLTNSGLRPLALLPEDLALAATGVGEIEEALGAEVLSEGDDPDVSVDDIVIAPVYTDPARPHFGRYGRTAILTPSYKTDLQLAAIESGTVCLVITGGRPPSHYVLDRVEHEPTTVLLAPQPTTVAALDALAGVWTNSRFRGVNKAQAVHALLGARLDFAAFARKLV